MKWGDLGKKIAGIGLPALGAALPLPGGALIGKMIADKLGMPGANIDAIAHAVATDPAAMVKLRELDVEIGAQDVQLAELEVKDRMDARTSTKDDTVRRWLAAPAVIAPVAFGVFLLVWQPSDTTGLGMFMLGALFGNSSQIYNYFFGTSIGSTKKQASLDQMERK
jgi:hypothetical protein